ncbi:hypothetical protein B0T20DRAFT_56379 [Sordaria brevicollis]|uniref:Uncharacterized protein n=1 Tax=Sordaria brevicollis TaxID=83679 RepID=A0AAE0P368_SORBR|nr:hypothetical protein B0T20DRAFT_56379 [Sordaria brevicollis]
MAITWRFCCSFAVSEYREEGHEEERDQIMDKGKEVERRKGREDNDNLTGLACMHDLQRTTTTHTFTLHLLLVHYLITRFYFLSYFLARFLIHISLSLQLASLFGYCYLDSIPRMAVSRVEVTGAVFLVSSYPPYHKGDFFSCVGGGIA